MAAVGVGSVKTEDVSRLEDIPEGALHLTLVYRRSESRSDERPTVGAAAWTPSACADGCRTGGESR